MAKVVLVPTEKLIYTQKEYDVLIKRIDRLEKELTRSYESCIKVCKSASTSWSIKDPEKMALFCAKLISNLALREGQGATPRLVTKTTYDIVYPSA